MAAFGTSRRAALASLVAAVLVALALDLVGPGRRVDAWIWDRLARLAAPTITTQDTVVFGLDDASITDLQPLLGPWPYRRDVWAHVIAYLHRAGATHVTIDVLLADPRDGDEQLRDALARHPQVALAAVPVPFAIGSDRAHPFDTSRGVRVSGTPPARAADDVFAPRAEFEAASYLGVATAAPDDDGLIRRLPVLTRVNRTYLPALAIAGLLGADRVVAEVRTWRGPSLTVGARRVPVDGQGQAELRYPATLPALETRPFASLVRAAVTTTGDADLSRLVAGRRVFVGATALLLEEAVDTPVGRLPGVEFVRLASVLVHDGAVVRSRQWGFDALVLMAAMSVLLVARRRRPQRAGQALVALLAAWATTLALVLVLLVGLEQRAWLHAPLVMTVAAAALMDLADLARLRRERTRLEAERHAAERASEMKTQFLNHVAHELRTPVTAILGFGRLIVEQRDPPATPEYARVITRNGAHLLQLVNNLLDDATLAVGRARVSPQPVAVRQLLSDVLATVEGLPRHDGVALSGEIAPKVPPFLLLDALRVRQVLLNLLANAMKFTEAGSIHLAVAWHEGTLTMAVHDTGSGMAPDVLARVFDEFEIGHPRAVRAGGTGLGLSVSRRLARLMGGDLTAAATEGVGSCFTLTVPAREVDAPPDESAGDEDAVEVDADGPLVLICDDIEDIRQLFAVVLASAGARVVTAVNGRDAVALAARLRPDAVLLDLDLPDQDGLITARQLRDAGYDGPVIAISGSGEDREATLRTHGFTDSARKPVSSALLTDLVARHVRHWRPRRATSRDA